ncbi:MAG: hypothetical protein QM666_11170 [Acinetobacter sp.]
MRFNTLATAILTSAVVAACSPVAVKNTTPVNEPIVFNEPDPSPAFYALNPLQYNEPPAFEVALKQAIAQPVTKMVATSQTDPTKTATFDVNKLIIPTLNQNKAAMKFIPLAGQDELDVTNIDDFLQLLEGKARHYPPKFVDKNERRGYETKLREILTQLEPLAENENASYDILIRTLKATVMARNLDLGQQYTTKSLQYAQRLVKMNPDDPETNFWFGFNLSEGGGQREAIPYLDKAIKAGVQEAYLSAVNNYLFLDQKKNALTTLNNYKIKYPQEKAVVEQLTQEIEKQGRVNVWENLTAMKEGKY